MPTPFMHLQIAERILTHAALSDQSRQMIQTHYSAFYLGSVAPDYQTICHVPREKTHFYDLPPGDGDLAYPKMFISFPELRHNQFGYRKLLGVIYSDSGMNIAR